MTWYKIFKGEFLGTLVLVFFGCGVIATALLARAQMGLWQIAVVWGIALALAIYLSAPLSGAHLNPAVTISLMLWRKSCDVRTAAVYVCAQLAGAITAGAMVLAIFGSAIARFESVSEIARGAPGSEISAMMFGEYFPNPGLQPEAKVLFADLGIGGAFGAELIGTVFLVMAVFFATNGGLPQWLQPLVIGMTLAIIISVIAPLTQAGFNPARDFGPRLVSYVAGWGRIAIPGPSNGFWIYLAGPIAGGIIGGGLMELMLMRSANVNEASGTADTV